MIVSFNTNKNEPFGLEFYEIINSNENREFPFFTAFTIGSMNRIRFEAETKTELINKISKFLKVQNLVLLEITKITGNEISEINELISINLKK